MHRDGIIRQLDDLLGKKARARGSMRVNTGPGSKEPDYYFVPRSLICLPAISADQLGALFPTLPVETAFINGLLMVLNMGLNLWMGETTSVPGGLVCKVFKERQRAWHASHHKKKETSKTRLSRKGKPVIWSRIH